VSESGSGVVVVGEEGATADGQLHVKAESFCLKFNHALLFHRRLLFIDCPRL